MNHRSPIARVMGTIARLVRGRQKKPSRRTIEADDVLQRRIYREYLEMPGLRLWPQQAQRLWALDEATSLRLLDSLVDTGFLCRTTDGMYLRHRANTCVAVEEVNQWISPRTRGAGQLERRNRGQDRNRHTRQRGRS